MESKSLSTIKALSMQEKKTSTNTPRPTRRPSILGPLPYSNMTVCFSRYGRLEENHPTSWVAHQEAACRPPVHLQLGPIADVFARATEVRSPSAAAAAVARMSTAGYTRAAGCRRAPADCCLLQNSRCSSQHRREEPEDYCIGLAGRDAQRSRWQEWFQCTVRERDREASCLRAIQCRYREKDHDGDDVAQRGICDDGQLEGYCEG